MPKWQVLPSLVNSSNVMSMALIWIILQTWLKTKEEVLNTNGGNPTAMQQ